MLADAASVGSSTRVKGVRKGKVAEGGGRSGGSWGEEVGRNQGARGGG